MGNSGRKELIRLLRDDFNRAGNGRGLVTTATLLTIGNVGRDILLKALPVARKEVDFIAKYWADYDRAIPDNGYGHHPIHVATEKGYDWALLMLLKKGVDVDSLGDGEDTALIRAACFGRKKAAKILIKHGADVNKGHINDVTPLLCAVTKDDEDLVSLLLENGADANAKTDFGATPFQSAARHGNRRVVKMLIEKGADINARFLDGDTALHLAALDRREEVVALLLEKGAEVNAQNENGATPLDYARSEATRKLIRNNKGMYNFELRPYMDMEKKK